MSDEFTLTDEQVENWRRMLITMPLPPLMMPLGAFALIMSREMVVKVAQRVQEELDVALDIEKFNKRTGCPPEAWESGSVKERAIRIYNNIQEEKKPTNIIRTRPRDPKKPVRR